LTKQVIYLVEGAHDKARLKELDNSLNVLITKGIKIKHSFIEQLKQLEKEHLIVLMFDPDYAGEQIRKRLTKALKNPYQIYLPLKLATNKKGDIGLEHLSLETLKELIKIKPRETLKSDLTNEFLYQRGYLNKANSRQKRTQLTGYFKIGYVNGKGLLKRLELFNIQEEEIIKYEKEVLRSTLS
jgi:ribonuclease M5